LTKFDISNCNLRAEGGKALAVGLKGNHVMTELNVAGNLLGLKADGSDDTSGIIAIADAIPDMGAMTKLNLSKNMLLTKEGGRALGNMLKANTILKELDVSSSGNRMHSSDTDAPGFTIEISEGLAGNGALYSLDLSENRLGAEGAEALAKMLKKGSLFCKDGNFFKSKGMLAQSTCRHCGEKRSSHGKVALSKLDVRTNGIPSAAKALLQGACDAKGVSLVL
jgi:hypothetical protein